MTKLTDQQALWIAAAVDYRDGDGVLDTAEHQLLARYVTISDGSGTSTFSNAELVVGLSSRRLGQRAGRKAFSGKDGARRRLEQRGLIKCDRSVTSKRHPRTGAWMVTPWSVTIKIDCENVRPFAWSSAPEWIVRMLGDKGLPAHARKVALRLSRALGTDGAFAGTRKELAEELDVHRDTAMKHLRLLEGRGLVALSKNHDRHATVFTITAMKVPDIAVVPVSQRTAAPKTTAPVPVATAKSNGQRVTTDALIEFEANGQAFLRATAPTPVVLPPVVAAPDPVIIEPVRLTVTPAQFNGDWFAQLRTTCLAFPGPTPVTLLVPDGTEKPLKTGPRGLPITIAPGAAFDAAVQELQQTLSIVVEIHSAPADEDEDDGFYLACAEMKVASNRQSLAA